MTPSPAGLARLVVVTPWYPTAERPHHGVFVREWTRALRHDPTRTLVVHLDHVPPAEVTAATRTTTPLGDLVRIPVGVEPLTPRAEMARRQRAALLAALTSDLPELAELSPADVVHAHVGMPSGWAVAGLLPQHTRLVVTEHATYLKQVLDDPVAQEMYGEILARSHRLLMVGESEARRVRTTFPHLAARVRTVGNPVPLDSLPFLGPPGRRLSRWLFVGNLVPRKGVHRVVDGFAEWHHRAPDPADRLVIAGGGDLADELRRQAAARGVGDRVELIGPVEPDEVPALLARSDVLVHLADLETFGLTVVEAAVSGLPVVVTACGGPEESLHDAAEAGVAEIVPVRPDAGTVADAVDRLAVRVRRADRAGVRDRLAHRYGDDAFGTRALQVLAGGEPDPLPDPSDPLVLTVALTRDGLRRLRPVHAALLRTGRRVGLVTDVAGESAAVDRRIDVLDLDRPELRSPLRRVEEVVLRRLVPLPLRLLRKVCVVASSRPGPHRRPAERGARVTTRLLSRLSRLTDRVQDALRAVVHRPLEAPRATRAVLAEYGAHPGTSLHVVAVDRFARALAARLVAAAPGARLVAVPTEAQIESSA